MSGNLEIESSENSPEDISLTDLIESYKNVGHAKALTRFKNVQTLLEKTIKPLFSNINGDPYSNKELGKILTDLTTELLKNRLEIENLHILNAKLIFELIEQGVKVEDNELINELEYIS